MGPLVEPAEFIEQIHASQAQNANAEQVAEGLKLFSYGLFKKRYWRIPLKYILISAAIVTWPQAFQE